MIYITQLIYLKEGMETVFHQFEDIAIPLLSKYNGRLLLRVRASAENYIAGNLEPPYEIHLVEFDDESDLANFNRDEERKKFVHLKEQSVSSTMLVKGAKL